MFEQLSKSLADQRLTGILLMALGIFQGCSAVPRNIAAPMPPANVEGYSALVSGRKTYVSLLKCAMCHRPKTVSDYPAQSWTEDILPRMSKKARLTPQEYADVLAYVTANSKQEDGTKMEPTK